VVTSELCETKGGNLLEKKQRKPRKRMRPDQQVVRSGGLPSYERAARREAREDHHLAVWLSYMGVGERDYPRSAKKTLLTRWERAELEKINQRRHDAWLERRRDVEARGGLFLEIFEALTYLPDSAYEAKNLMHFVTEVGTA